MLRLTRLLFLGAICLAFMVGCGGDDDSANDETGTSSETTNSTKPGSDSDQSPSAGSTPEATFAAFQKAISIQDWNAASRHLTDESQSRLALAVVFAGSMFAAFDESKAEKLQEILDRHGIGEDTMSDSEVESDTDAVAMINSTVRDKPALLHDMIGFMEEGASDSEGGFSSMATAVLGPVQTDGEEAHGKLTIDGKEETVDFVRVAGVWKLVLPEDDFALGDGEMGMEFGDGGFGMGEEGFGDEFDFGFDESDAMPPVEPVALADLEDAWKTSIDVTDEPAIVLIDRMAAECGLEVIDREKHAEQLALPVTMSLENASRLEIIERACEQAGLYPRYRIRRMTFGKGERPRPVAFAGPFIVTLPTLDEHVPYTTATTEWQVFAAAVPIGLLSHVQNLTPSVEEAEDALTLRIDTFTGSNGEELENNMEGEYETLVSTTSCLAAFGGTVRGLTSKVEGISTIKGEVTLPVPVEIASMSFSETKAGAEQASGSAKMSIEEVELAETPDGQSTVSVKFSGFEKENMAMTALDKDGQPVEQMGYGGFGSADGSEYDFYFAGIPKSLEVRTVTKTERVRFPFEITDIPLQQHARMPDTPPVLKFDGKTPITVEFVAITGEGEDREITLKATNHANLPVSMLSLELTYFDAAGKELEKSPHTQGGGREMIKAGETMDLEVSSFFMPEEAASVTAKADYVYFADDSEWTAEEE